MAAGARVIVADNGTSIAGEGADPTVARETAAAFGKTAIAFTDSVASPGAAKHLVELALKEFGGLDIVVNNAAIKRDDPVSSADPRDWDAVIRNNLSAPFYLTNAASAVMRAQGRGGCFINIVSSSGLSAGLGQAAYASAKAGLFGLTRATAMDLAEAQITANAIVLFPHTTGAHHVADLVTALCSPTGKAITGQLLGVRGREIFLFGQPRPVARIEAGAPEALAKDLHDKLGDLEGFDTDSLV